MPFSPDGVQRAQRDGTTRQRRCRARGRAAPGRARRPRAAGNRQISRQASRNQAGAACTQAPGAGSRPRWKQLARELWFGGVLVKRFCVPARNQTLILAAFEEEGWPPRMDDPLPPVAGTNCKRRLHNAINCLNRAHRARVMRFFGDGTGTGICWKLV